MARLRLLTEHPRARGENIQGKAESIVTAGTSPRTRGKRRNSGFWPWPCRNIPAHAGKTLSSLKDKVTSTEHPRARGENMPPQKPHLSCAGTSPRTRGKLYGTFSDGGRLRNIPAHAGKTRAAVLLSALTPEHPRARGENVKVGFLTCSNSGTSPRTRGKPHPVTGEERIYRNIPAHAGKTRPNPVAQAL